MLFAACGGGGGGSTVAPFALTYDRDPAFYPKGITIAPNAPANAGGAAKSWSVAPPLPPGLSLDATTGVISGKPSLVTPRGLYTVTASNSAGKASVALDLEIVRPALMGVAANIKDDTLTVYVLDALSGRLRPHGYARAGAGEIDPRSVVVHPGNRVVYVVNNQSANVSVYDLDRSTGQLTSRTPVSVPGGSPTQMLLHPTLDVAYVLSNAAPGISTFDVDPATGDLTLLATASGGAGAVAGAIDSLGHFLYAADTGNRTLATFALDPQTGVPSPAGTPVVTGVTPNAVALGAGDRFAYVLNLRSTYLDVFALDPTSGQPSPAGSAQTGVYPAGMAFEPTRRFLYVALSDQHEVLTYRADPDTGQLTQPLPPTPTGQRPVSVTIDPSGSYLYVPSLSDAEVDLFSIDYASGALSPLGEARAREQPRQIALVSGDGPPNPRPKFAYVSNRISDDLSQYAAQVSGQLDLGPTIPLNGMGPRGLASDIWARFLYCSTGLTNDLSVYAIDPATGDLTEVQSAVPAGSDPRGLAVEPSGRFLYVAARGSDEVHAFALDASSGALSPLAVEATGGEPIAVACEPTGRFAYVACQASNEVWAYAIDSVSGSLTLQGAPLTAAGRPSSIAFHPSGRFLYAALEDLDLLAVYAIDAADGSLAIVGSDSTGVQPTSVAVDPKGRWAYTVDHDSGAVGSVSTFTLDPVTGMASSIGRFIAGVNPISAVVSPQGRFLYVANEGSDDITLFLINSQNGLLVTGPPAPAGSAPSALAVATELQ
jgi:6-phosphogluconolactonase (cycloisomerase 2 family)